MRLKNWLIITLMISILPEMNRAFVQLHNFNFKRSYFKLFIIAFTPSITKSGCQKQKAGYWLRRPLDYYFICLICSRATNLARKIYAHPVPFDNKKMIALCLWYLWTPICACGICHQKIMTVRQLNSCGPRPREHLIENICCYIRFV